MSGIELTTEVMVLPEGMELDHDELHRFAVRVQWRGVRGETGRGGYRVTDGFDELSRAGKWGNPQRFQQHQYRWDTLEEALEMARKHVDELKVNRRTWSEWQTFFAANRDGDADAG